ncbi:hypothetical protein COCC4DRAFT_54905 [Bipolaris maydis ATCC 48331]|uniref:Uncharacterized protein n=1 Tax=Cochliobolus heterostrophus (strain C4 / ATCC 48331 / race T) TaxID=665024 RepID=N4WE48_COCH4|nr:uncharacterized protein COCC4DRAFT_54905 [Bipolaris maydis ATCC 48331]KAJ5020984.1 hypothetical protein J3E73DRAFT_242061 [Bipolaris maydis]ENH98528.1 hypothetical protein COCC4DRAFT_54905 [Bipolaris maydis ATCC 48331]KAJ5028331.1 hypothetical protein J3E73DRAFT_379663 [Bipolaris maydis]KAJ6203495.1 hypothetical protein PSV09DRAFT_2438181 [Bipolaris maydis]KAJ6271756.1 hypothetical protein PSV08DRAFT_400667 [Bipolaris maydis]
MQFLKASTILSILAFAAATPVPEENAQALSMVKRMPANNVPAVPISKRTDAGLTDLIKDEDHHSLTKRVNSMTFTVPSRLASATYAFGVVSFKLVQQTAETWTIQVTNLAVESITAYVKNLSLDIDIFAEAVNGLGKATEEGVKISGGDRLEFSYS